MRLFRSYTTITVAGLIGVLLSLSSCRHIYGYGKATPLSAAQLPAPFHTWVNPVYELDSSYCRRLQQLIPDAELRCDMSQPLQFWYFKDGRLLTNTGNRFARGFPNLCWRISSDVRNQRKRGASRRQPLTLSQFFACWNRSLREQGTTFIICSDAAMGRQHTRFLKAVARYMKQNTDTAVALLLDTRLLSLPAEEN